jgi:hypothetical protein
MSAEQTPEERLDSERRGLVDATEQDNKAADDLLEIEHEVARLELKERQATAAAEGDLANDAFAAAVLSVRDRLATARGLLSKRQSAKSATGKALEEQRAAVDAAERAVEAQALKEQITSDDYETATRDDVLGIVASIVDVRTRLLKIRERTESHNAKVARFHAAGGRADLAPRDGTCAGGFFAQALLTIGAHFAGQKYSDLRHPFDLNAPGHQLAAPLVAVESLVRTVIAGLQTAEIDRAAGFPDRHVDVLEHVARVWPGARSLLDEADASARDERERADEQAAKVRKAHSKRLQVADARRRALTGVPVGNGQPIPKRQFEADHSRAGAPPRGVKPHPAAILPSPDGLGAPEGEFIPSDSVDGLSLDPTGPHGVG